MQNYTDAERLLAAQCDMLDSVIKGLPRGSAPERLIKVARDMLNDERLAIWYTHYRAEEAAHKASLAAPVVECIPEPVS